MDMIWFFRAWKFIVDAIQGGAGTSANMNMNEVLANRANEWMGGRKGDYSRIHPNDHVSHRSILSG